jgi:hypothetical protein
MMLHFAECHYAQYHYASCRYTEFCNAECSYGIFCYAEFCCTQYHYAEFCVAVMVGIVMLKAEIMCLLLCSFCRFAQ